MPGNQFPAVVVGRVDLRIRRVKEGDIRLVPIEIAITPERLGIKQLLLVENLCRADACQAKQQKQGNHGATEQEPLLRLRFTKHRV